MQEGTESCTLPVGKTSAAQNLLQVKNLRNNNPQNQLFQPTERQGTTAEGDRSLKTPWILTIHVFIAYIYPRIPIPSKKEGFWLLVWELKGSRNTRESKWSTLILKTRSCLSWECPRSASYPSQVGINTRFSSNSGKNLLTRGHLLIPK